MSNVAVRVEGLGKLYRIGGKQERYRTLRDSLTDAVSAPFRRARSLLHGQAYGAAGLEETIWALKDVSFEVHHGEVVGIIGRNGAGKSTLLKILSRITEPTEGYADVYGRVGSLLEVGTGFHPELTGRENIYLNGAILGMTRAEIDRKFDEIVDFAEVERFIDTPVKHYSSGMGLRLGFAVAAHLEPEILVVDEVLAVGDAQFQKKCLGKMSDVAGEGRTVLFVSHNMAAVRNLCLSAVLLENGSVGQTGDVNSVISTYLKEQMQSNERSGPIGGVKHLQIEEVELRDMDGSPVDIVSSCQPVQFIIRYSTLTNEPVKNVRFALRVLDTMDQHLFAFANYFTDGFKDIPPEGQIVCEVPGGLPLTEDEYKVTLAVQIEGSFHAVLHDILSFTIVATDVFGTGRFPDKFRLNHGAFVVPQKEWKIRA